MSPLRSLDNVNDWAAETSESIDARLEGAKSSQAQTRLTLGTMALVSIMMLIASYNAYLSYDYYWIRDEVGPTKSLATKTAPYILMEQALKDWASARTVQVSLLGIRVSVDDAPVLGSSILSVLSLWLFLVARRENHTIGFLLRDTDTPRPSSQGADGVQSAASAAGQRWLIFHTILASSIFATCDPSLAQVTSLDGPLDETRRNSLVSRVGRACFRLARSFFFLFPAMACVATFIVDRCSYVMRDPFKENFAFPEIEPFFRYSMLIFFACWSPLMLCCWRANLYSTATERVLREYGQKLSNDLLQSEVAQHEP